MKINISGFNISAQGMSVQRKKMNIVAENIAMADIRNEDGTPYKRKVLDVSYKETAAQNNQVSLNQPRLMVTNPNHITMGAANIPQFGSPMNMKAVEKEDTAPGQMIYNPGDTFANSEGYVENSNVNVITEMVDMIAASRNYEANLTAFNSSKQIAKDSMEI